VNTWEIQAQRRAAEREPIDWDTYRLALIESGMVEEARKRRESETLDDKIGAYPTETWLRQISSVGDLLKRCGAEEVTLVDELWEEEHGAH
jgi:hypothetical protein